MAKVLSSISGNLISAASAGYAPTNGADVSAIASAYQVVSATGTQTYAGTAYVTSLNSAPVSAERAGNAANAALANSAWYDGTGRFISALPDSAAVSAIASAYASGKQDSSAMSAYALSSDVSGVIDTVSGNSAAWGETAYIPLSSTAIEMTSTAYSASYNLESIDLFVKDADSSNVLIEPDGISFKSGNGTNIGFVDPYHIGNWDGVYNTVLNNSGSWTGGGGGGGITTATATAYKQNSNGQLVTYTGVASADGKPLIAETIKAAAVQNIGTANFYYGPGKKPFTANTAGIYAPLQYATGACLAMDGGTYRAYYKGNEWFVSDYSNSRSGAVRAEVHSTRGIHISGSNTAGVGFDLLTTGLKFADNTGTTSMTPANIDEWKSCHNTVSANSASWGGGGGGGIDSATCSAIASSYAESAISSNYAGIGISLSDDNHCIAVNYFSDGPLGTTGDYNQLTVKTDGSSVGVNANGELEVLSAPFDSAAASAIASSYAESAVSSKQDSSAMSAYALSADVSGVIDTVSSNSATWGGGGNTTFGSSFSGSGTVESPVDLNGYLVVPSPNTKNVLYLNTPTDAGVSAVYMGGTRSAWLHADNLGIHRGDFSYNTSITVYPSTVKFRSGAYNQTAEISYNSITSYNSHSANWESAYSLISGVTALLDAI